ncbi:6-bladed beta-propeller [Thermincola potens]|uniref:NHL repeat containing protein n=1 Tax=Thermincola potens (strain JR) TaxID=635013 RepID=D5XEC2_THEPJ|nr:6-bladed beta-propeller [Thermincola potens]ADG81993.1 NHL repeat containing protein [Thermincola potens JR]
MDLVFGPKGLLYVADLYKGRVFAFDLNGKLHKIYPSTAPGEEVTAISPTAIAFDKKGNLYVTDVGRQRVAVFDPAGRFLFSFGQEGTGKGEFLFPNGIAVDTAGNKVYVADTNNLRIQVFNEKGKFETVFPMPQGIRLSAPRGLTITGKRELLFVDTLANQMYFINLKSRTTNVVELSAGMAFPNDITGNGRKFFVADRGNKRLISFTINSGEVKKHEE